MKSRHFFYQLFVILFSTMALQSFAALVVIQTKVTELWPRDWGFHVVMESQTLSQLTTLQCTGNNLQYPLVLLTNPNYKTYKDTIMLAYTLKRNIRVFFENSTPCAAGVYPIIYAVDLLAQ